MSSRKSHVQRTAAFTLSITALLGVACLLPLHSFGQEPDKAPPNGQDPNKPAFGVEKRQNPVTGNPLQIRIPKEGDAESAPPPATSQDFGDYRYTQAEKANSKPLPLFGYDIFRFARETIDAQRKFMRRQAISDVNTGDESVRRGSRRSGDDTADSSDIDRVITRKSDKSDDASDNTGRKRRDDTGDAGSRNRRDDSRDSTDGSRRDEGDSRSEPRRNSRTYRRPADSDTSDEYDDGSYDNPPRRNRNGRQNNNSGDSSTDASTPNDPYTPVGPIGLLYKGISASIPANYQLSTGDELKVRIESPTLEPITVKRTVDARGQIQLDNIGDVVVRGLTIPSAEKLLEIRLKPYYKNARVSIETGRLRLIQVLVSGAAYEPGSYTVPAVATAFNLINIAGGPADDGSLRSIEVRRHGKRVATIDVYKMLTGDAQLSDVPLEAGDVILIPPRKSRVIISGEVLRPAVFELLPDETLRDALNYAGGVKASGLNQSIRINTVVPGQERIIKDVNLADSTLQKQTLYDGDEVQVFSVRSRLTNRVTIEGAVDQPNDYALQPGMRVADLLERARGPLSEAYLQKAELHRWQPDNTDMLMIIDLEKALAKDPRNNLELQKWDRIKVYTREEVAWTGRRKVEVYGAVKKPGVYDVSKNMRVSDLLRMAGGPTPDAELEKAHLFHHRDDSPDLHEYVNVAAAIKGDPGKDPEVLDSDKLVLFSVDQAEYTPEHRVDIKGEVVNPGRYPRFTNMRVSDLLAMAGGFKPSATNSVVLAHARRVADAPTTKVVTIAFDAQRRCAPQDDVELEDGDVISVQAVGGFQPEVESITVRGAVNKPGIVFLKSKNMRLSDAIKEAGGLRPEAFPPGAQFYRDPQMLATLGQRSLVQNLANLNDLLNDSETKREMAKAQLELVKATGAAISDSSPLAGLNGAAAATPNPAASAVANNISGQQLVSPARKLSTGQLDPNGYIAIDLPGALAKPRSADDIILVDGDAIVIPEKPTTVQVVGAVNSARGILYEPGKRLDYYVDLAGGFAPDAAKDRIEVFHMGGGVIPAKRVRDLQPGDIVFVPTKVLAAKIAGHGNGFDSFFKSLTSSAILFKLATGIFGL